MSTSSEALRWHKVAESLLEIARVKGSPWQTRVGGKDICLVVHQGKGYATAARCPHAGGIMAQGRCDALGNLVCPLHQYKFSLQNGRNVSGEGYFLKTYPVVENEDGVFVGL